jgi:two-component system phosphate regulon sensor histidine kinase PhoR
VTIRTKTDHAQNRFYFEVEDSGLGIPENLQAKIFERFFRAKQPGAEHISGTGLGLSLVKSIIEQHGGRLWFSSTPGKGSTFTFWLPLPESSQR